MLGKESGNQTNEADQTIKYIKKLIAISAIIAPWLGIITSTSTLAETELTQYSYRANSGTWAATDALGRVLPTSKDVGLPKKDKQVGMFYWIWHVGKIVENEPVNMELVSKRFPQAVNNFNHDIWQRIGKNNANTTGHGNHWNEPLFGYYRSTDPWVLRKHIELLADAQVDFIVFDATNGTKTWQTSYDVLFPVLEQAKADGINTPKVAFMMPFGPLPNSLVSVKKLYKDIYRPGRYKDHWFMLDNKPFIMAYPDNVPEPIKSFFTFRPGQPVYKTGPTRADHWGWLEIYPQHGFGNRPDGGFEQATVSVAQNASESLWPAAMNSTDEVLGRGYTVTDGPNHSQDAIARGLNFQEQWQRAFELDPDIVFVTGWNEWIAGRFEKWQQTENAFPDQFNDEYSRDIEPLRGGFADNYYYQLVANIRQFKGVPSVPAVSPGKTIRIDGNSRDWQNVTPEYQDHQGDTQHRNHPGYGRNTLYKNETGRNDIVSAKVTKDKNNVYFLVKTAENITKPEGEHWMMLLIDLDRDKSTGWQGYEFAVNRSEVMSKAFLEFNQGEWVWAIDAPVAFAVSEKTLEVAIPKAYLGLKDEPLNFEFKWVDNMQGDGNVMGFYTSGDAAPSGRFNYVYRDAAFVAQ